MLYRYVPLKGVCFWYRLTKKCMGIDFTDFGLQFENVYGFKKPGLEMGFENDIFWSEIGG